MLVVMKIFNTNYLRVLKNNDTRINLSLLIDLTLSGLLLTRCAKVSTGGLLLIGLTPIIPKVVIYLMLNYI